MLVRLVRKPHQGAGLPAGRVMRVLERASHHFVGTYFERDGEGLVRVDGTVFSHSVFVGDAGAKGARLNDKVVIEMVRFPGPDDRGEGVIVEVLGPHGQPAGAVRRVRGNARRRGRGEADRAGARMSQAGRLSFLGSGRSWRIASSDCAQD